MDTLDTVTLAGTAHAVRLPSFADREDIVRAFREAESIRKSRPVFAGTLALCVPELPQPKTLDECDGDMIAFGAPIYEALRASGAKAAEIAEGATACFRHVVRSLYPREEEVAATEDFSGAGAKPT
jgi:hypothetical protein